MITFLKFVQALMYYRIKGSCVEIAEILGNISHDTLTRFLKGNWSGQKRLESILLKIKGLSEGYLIIDDTISEKEHARKMKCLSRHYCTTKQKTVFGYCTVMLIWTDGNKRIPISLRLWRPGGKSKIELALDMLSYARNQLGLKPKFVLFDTWYAAKAIFKRLDDYGWHFVTRLKPNRKFNGITLSKISFRPYWHKVGFLQGGCKVFVVKNGDKFFASNRLTISRKELLHAYSVRFIIEEFHRIVKQECCFSFCQLASFEAQEHYRFCSIFAFLVLERERCRLGLSFYKLRKVLTRRDSILSIPYFESFLASA